MTGLHETGIITGTRDKDYNLVSFVQSCLKNALRMGIYIRDAERDGDTELVELFRKAQAASRDDAEIGKKLLATRLIGGTAARSTAGGVESGAGTGSGRDAENGRQAPPTDVMATEQAPPSDIMAPNQVTPEQG